MLDQLLIRLINYSLGSEALCLRRTILNFQPTPFLPKKSAVCLYGLICRENWARMFLVSSVKADAAPHVRAQKIGLVRKGRYSLRPVNRNVVAGEANEITEGTSVAVSVS